MERRKREAPERVTGKSGASGYRKEQIVNSERYRKDRDLVQALLCDGVEYTLEEVDRMMEDYRKGKVR